MFIGIELLYDRFGFGFRISGKVSSPVHKSRDCGRNNESSSSALIDLLLDEGLSDKKIPSSTNLSEVNRRSSSFVFIRLGLAEYVPPIATSEDQSSL